MLCMALTLQGLRAVYTMAAVITRSDECSKGQGRLRCSLQHKPQHQKVIPQRRTAHVVCKGFVALIARQFGSHLFAACIRMHVLDPVPTKFSTHFRCMREHAIKRKPIEPFFHTYQRQTLLLQLSGYSQHGLLLGCEMPDAPKLYLLSRRELTAKTLSAAAVACGQ